MLKRSIAILLLGSLVTVPGVCWGKTSRFRDLTREKIISGNGAIEFRLKLLKDISSDPHNHVLFLGVSSDRAEEYKLEIIQDKLIVHRRFGRCVLAAFTAPNDLRIGEWYTLRLAWNGPSSKFTINGREVPRLGLLSSEDLPKFILPGIRLGVESNFKIEGFRSAAESDVRSSPEDQEFVKSVVCTDLAQLLEERPQEEYRGVAFRNFPDQGSRDKVRSYIDLLPEGFAGVIRNVIFVEDERFLKGGQGGFADSISGSLVLKGSLFQEPLIFFHEAAHLYDTKLGINFGVPEEKSEWAAISGASCYFKGGKMEEFYNDFLKTNKENAILGAQGGQCASEDLAIWVGTVYDRYLKGQTMADRLDPASPKYSPKSLRKMDFILKKGFISQKVYDQMTRFEPGRIVP